jgi:hypothetical protein
MPVLNHEFDVLCIWRENHAQMPTKWNSHFKALAIVPTGKDNVYRRVGQAEIFGPEFFHVPFAEEAVVELV